MKPKKVLQLDPVQWNKEVAKLSKFTFPPFTQPLLWNTPPNIMNSLRQYQPMTLRLRLLMRVYRNMTELERLSPSGAGIIAGKCERFSDLYLKVFEDQSVYWKDYDLVIEKALEAAESINNFIRLNKPLYEAPCRKYKNLKAIMDDIEKLPEDIARMIRHIKNIIQQTHTDR